MRTAAERERGYLIFGRGAWYVARLRKHLMDGVVGQVSMESPSQ
jgi:hypothetical protein